MKEIGQEKFCFGGFSIEVDDDEGVGGDQQAEREEGKEQRMGEDGADEDGGNDERPKGHEEEGHDMGVDADRDVCSFGGIDEVTVGDGLPGVMPVEDAADDEAVLVEAADVGAGGVAY